MTMVSHIFSRLYVLCMELTLFKINGYGTSNQNERAVK